MARVNGLIRILEDREMELIHETALSILDTVGMRINHDAALNQLEAAGCRVDRARWTVQFPPPVVEAATQKLRASFELEGRAGERVPMRYSALYFSTQPRAIHHNFDVNAGGFQTMVLDLDGKRHPATMRDVRDSIRLADSLEHIDLIGLPCAAQEVPAQLRPVMMAAELVKHTSKPGGVEAWSVADVEYLSRIGAVVRGGEDAFRRHPVLLGYGEARSPLCLDRNMAEIFMEYVRRGMPQSLDTMPCGGTTAPASSAGTLAMGIAETLGGLVLAYAVNPDAMVGIDVCPSLADMKTQGFPYAGPDRLPLVAAGCQMISEFYKRPGGCHGGKTDACVPGAQAGIEKALSIIFPILAGATGIGTLGGLENAMTFSYEQLVIDDEIVGYIKRMLQGFEVTEETLALPVIQEIGIGGNFLQHEHTARSFRKEFYLAGLLERMPWEMFQRQELKGIEERARERVREILRQEPRHPLSGEAASEIDGIVAAAGEDVRYR